VFKIDNVGRSGPVRLFDRREVRHSDGQCRLAVRCENPTHKGQLAFTFGRTHIQTLADQ